MLDPAGGGRRGYTLPQAGTTLPEYPTFSVPLLQHVPTSNMKRAPYEEGDSGAADDKNPSLWDLKFSLHHQKRQHPEEQSVTSLSELGRAL